MLLWTYNQAAGPGIATTKPVCSMNDWNMPDPRLMPEVVQSDADLYSLPVLANTCHTLCMSIWAAQCRSCHEDSSGAQPCWILGVTGCAHLKQDCSECRIEGLKVVRQLYHDRLELGLCTGCCKNGVRCLTDRRQASAETQCVGLDQLAYPIRFQAIWLNYH